MTPREARKLLRPVGGKLLHAFWTKWPGPRVSYSPYQALSRRMFMCIDQILEQQALAGRGHAGQKNEYEMEKTSIDECYIQLHVGSVCQACQVARTIQRALLKQVGVRVSIGIGQNKLIAKLASVAAKRQSDQKSILPGLLVVTGGCVDRTRHVQPANLDCDPAIRFESVHSLLRRMEASRLPGLGAPAKKGVLQAVADRLTTATGSSGKGTEGGGSGSSGCSSRQTKCLCIDDLQLLSVQELQQSALCNSAAAASKIWRQCRGVDESVVCSNNTRPKSLVATSWLASSPLSELCLKQTQRGPSSSLGGQVCSVQSFVCSPVCAFLCAPSIEPHTPRPSSLLLL
jgi:hypothetical protein